jgi:hypothetical protein
VKPSVVDEAGRVKDALSQYETAYDNLDAAAVRAVYPSAPANLANVFAQYQFYRLEIVIQRITVSPDATTATALCRLSHLFQPKVGREHREARTQEFSFQKRGNSWIITGIQTR